MSHVFLQVRAVTCIIFWSKVSQSQALISATRCPQEQVSLQGYVRLALLYSAEQYGITSPSCVHATGSHYCTGWTRLQFKSNVTSLPLAHAPGRL